MDIHSVVDVYNKFKKFEKNHSNKPLIETQQVVEVIVSYLEKGYISASEEVEVKALESELIWTQYNLIELEEKRRNKWYNKLWRKVVK